jgi:Raf kinase inhibitor-like YbhB/YbcL family protein
MSFQLTSTDFEQGRPISRRFTGEGENVSPTLKWTAPPAGTKSLALLCEDPDAPRGTFTHWIAFDIPIESRELGTGILAEATLPNGMSQGKNGFGKLGYGGPKPPPGKPHRYFFKLFALDAKPNLKAGCGRDEFLQALQGHVLGEAQLMGTFEHGQHHDLPNDPIDKAKREQVAGTRTAPLS